MRRSILTQAGAASRTCAQRASRRMMSFSAARAMSLFFRILRRLCWASLLMLVAALVETPLRLALYSAELAAMPAPASLAMPVEGVTFRIRAVVETSLIEVPRVPARGADEPLLPVRTTTLRVLGDIDGGGDGAQEAHV